MRIRALFAIVVLAFAAAVAIVQRAPMRDAHAANALSSEASVTVYAASWCSACKSLEHGLRERGVPFDRIDIEQNPKAYDVAKRATGKSVIPLTSVARGSEDVVWIVGADVDAVEKAYRGE